MKLLLYGVSHQTVSEEDSEKYRIKDTDIKNKLNEIKQFSGVDEVVIFSNEDRTEFYLHVDEKQFSHGDILKFISKYSMENLETVIMESYSKFNRDVIRHLLSVLSQQSSVTKQEMTVLEVADFALETAIKNEASGLVLSNLFEQAVCFSLHMRALPSMRSYYGSDFSKTLRKLIKEWNSLEYRRFYLTGTSHMTIFLAKALFYLGASSVTIGRGDLESTQIAQELNEWANRVSTSPVHKIFKSGEKTLSYYQISSADGIIFEDSFDYVDSLSEEMEAILSLRLTKKKQVFIFMLSQSISVSQSLATNGFRSLTTLDLQLDEEIEGMTEEEKDAAKCDFEVAFETEVEKVLNNYRDTLFTFFSEHISEKKTPFTTF